MHLESDIKKETLLNFISIIKNQELKFHVGVEFLSKTPNNAEIEVIPEFKKKSEHLKGKIPRVRLFR